MCVKRGDSSGMSAIYCHAIHIQNHILIPNHCGWWLCHEIKRCFLLGKKAMTNLDSVLNSRDITLPARVCAVKAMAFPVVMYKCESWAIKKAKHWRIDAFKLWCWRRLLKVPWTARRSNQLILKESWSWSSNTSATWCQKSIHSNRPWCWKRLSAGREESKRGWDDWMSSWLSGQWIWGNWEIVKVRKA